MKYTCWKCGQSSYDAGGRPVCCHCGAKAKLSEDHFCVRDILFPRTLPVIKSPRIVIKDTERAILEEAVALVQEIEAKYATEPAP